MGRRGKATALLTVALVLLAVALWLMLDNPTVDVAAADLDDAGQAAGRVGCSIAPWDAGLNGNDDPPGGEHAPAFSEEVATDCHAANLDRFRAAIAAAVLGLGSAVAAGLLGARREPAEKTIA